MDKQFDINEFVKTETNQSVLACLVERERERRKELRLSQKVLALRSGVSYASIRRFESTGEISLTSLLKIGDAIGCLSDFNKLFKNKKIISLKDYSYD